jgi:hypothetical protein
MDQKARSNNLLSTETYLTTKDTHKLKVEGWKMIYQACGDQKQAGVTTLISDKAYFKQKVNQKR